MSSLFISLLCWGLPFFLFICSQTSFQKCQAALWYQLFNLLNLWMNLIHWNVWSFSSRSGILSPLASLSWLMSDWNWLVTRGYKRVWSPEFLTYLIVVCIDILLNNTYPQAGADVNSAKPNTPLEVAIVNGLTDCIKCLLEAGADPNIAKNQVNFDSSQFLAACRAHEMQQIIRLTSILLRKQSHYHLFIVFLHPWVWHGFESICSLSLYAHLTPFYGITWITFSPK